MKNNIRLATIISYLTLGLGNVISIVYTPFMLSTLGESEYGIFTLVNTIISYIYLLDMGLGNAIIRYNSKYMAENDKENLQKVNGMFLLLYSFIAIIGVIIGIILYFNLDLIFTNGLTIQEIFRLKIMFIIAIINLVFAFPFNVFNGIISANEKFVFLKTITFIRTILNPIIMVTILVFGYRAIGMLAASTIFNILIGFINIFYCFKVLKVKLVFKGFNRKLYKEIFKYSFYIFLSAIAYKIYWSTDQIILGMFVSSSAIAVYSIGMQLNSYFTSFSNVINNMFLPRLTKITTIDESKDELMQILIRVSRIQGFIALYILVGFILVGKQFIARWAGDNYELSYYIALLVMVPQLLSIIQALFATMLEAMNRHKVKAFIYLGVSVFNLILTLILVNYLETIGCAIATAIGVIINTILNNIYYSKKLKLNMRYYWRQVVGIVLPATLSLIVGVGLVVIIKPSSYVSIFLFIVLFTMEYFMLCWNNGFNKFEKNTFIYMFKDILEKVFRMFRKVKFNK